MDKIKEKIQSLCTDVMETAIVRIGSRVIPTELAIKNGLKRRTNWGQVVGESRDGKCWSVQWDGFKSKQSYAKEYIENSIVDERSITLAVVLRAMEKQKVVAHCNVRGQIDASPFRGHCVWNLEHDNYDDQSDECKQFIGSLLLTHEA